jgi:hypothetical protein
MGDKSDENINEPANRFGLDKVTITALVAGIVNLVGGATAVKGWLTDLGIRYYDGLSTAFMLPAGTFVPDDKHLISSGYSVLLDSSYTIGWTLFIIPALFAYLFSGFIVASTLIRISPINRIGIRKLSENMKHLGTTLLTLFAVFITVTLSYGLYQAVYIIPQEAFNGGRREASGIMMELNRQKQCENCGRFGKDRIIGYTIFTDGKVYFVATKNATVRVIKAEDFNIYIAKTLKDQERLWSPPDIVPRVDPLRSLVHPS